MNNSSNDPKCPFCKSSTEYGRVDPGVPLYRFDCPICKRYFISISLYEKIRSLPVNSELLNCISENISSNTNEGEIITSWHSENESQLPTLAANVTVKRYEAFARLPIIHASKPAELLNSLAGILSEGSPFQKGSLSLKVLLSLKINGFEEGYEWLKHLTQTQMIKSDFIEKTRGVNDFVPSDFDLKDFYFQITVQGWHKVYENRKSINSKSVFVAMQFDWGVGLEGKRADFIEAVRAGCRDSGYLAEPVNAIHHIDQITDRIVAQIKSSRFVVVDFTFNNRGAYYEAGLARGLGIPVIHTVMRGHTNDSFDKEKQLHFDIRQINYLEWDDAHILKESLQNRIKAVIEP